MVAQLFLGIDLNFDFPILKMDIKRPQRLFVAVFVL